MQEGVAMTIAIEVGHHRLQALLADAEAAIREEAVRAFRPEEFRRLWRKAHTALRAHGYGEGHQEGAAKALRAAFPEYAAWIPARLERYDDTLPRELTEVLGRPVAAVAVADPPPLAMPGDTDEPEEECDHEDHPWTCTRCGGLHENDCHAEHGYYHRFGCDDCGSELEECRDCEAGRGCHHQWRCQECDAIDHDGTW